MQYGEFGFLNFGLVLLGAAVLSVPIARRLGLSAIVAYLIAGIIIGPHGLAAFGTPESIIPISELGVVMLLFIGYFLHLMRHRAQMPPQVAAHAPHPELLVERARQRRQEERRRYGPYVALIGSAYLWGSLGALLLVIDGSALLLFGTMPVAVDAIRHSFAIGFITLLICGIAVRLVPGFSSKMIRSPQLVTATLVLGNLAALLRVGDSAEIAEIGSEEKFPARITVVSPATDPNSTTVEVWAQAANSKAKLRPGTTVEVSIQVRKFPDALTIPASAVIKTDSGPAVMAVVTDNKNPKDPVERAKQQPVKLGIRSGDDVQIISGLQAGQKIVATGAYGIPDNTQIQEEGQKSDEAKASDSDKDKHAQVKGGKDAEKDTDH